MGKPSQKPFWAPKKDAAKGNTKGEKIQQQNGCKKGKPTRGYLWVGKTGTPCPKYAPVFNILLGILE